MIGGRGRGGGVKPGAGAGRGQGMGRRRVGSGPAGECVCPSCGARATHQPGVPCTTVKCPKCGTMMVRG